MACFLDIPVICSAARLKEVMSHFSFTVNTPSEIFSRIVQLIPLQGSSAFNSEGMIFNNGVQGNKSLNKKSRPVRAVDGAAFGRPWAGLFFRHLG